RNGFWAITPFKYTNHMPISIRHLIPLLFFLFLILSSISFVFIPWSLWFSIPILLLYFILANYFAIKKFKELRYLSFFLPLFFFLLHFTYGLGSLFGLFNIFIPIKKGEIK
ncbi:MAG: hypothetical protein KKF62_01730, partial [Bacteroidetes bacterium]|nr:hypothetical protein [Bacteroidota bacterium]MBU1797591.1 hypothetical protein [Bacteroidota bacterium]